MNMSEYTHRAHGLIRPRKHSQGSTPNFWAEGLVLEAAEVLELFHKYEKDGTLFDTQDLALELGDVLWNLTMLADYYGFTLEGIASMNIKKLEDRYADHSGRSR